MSRVTHFEVPANDVDRCQSFYEKAFGWTFSKFGDSDYWLIATGEGPGIDGGMMKRNPGQPVTNSIGVPDIDAAIAAVEAAGGVVVVPKLAIAGAGWLAYFRDTEENIFGLMQPDTSAV
jgi:hypothetical protein